MKRYLKYRAYPGGYRRRKKDAKLVELQHHLIDHAEGERLQLARELHDGPIQDLHTLILQMEGFSNTTNGDIGRQLGSVKEKVQQVIQALRDIARELRPPALAPYGLEKAILSHADYLAQSHPDMVIHLNLLPDGQLLPEHVRLGLFRIYQIAISNVIRHARANWVEVVLLLDAEAVTLSVRDDGCGFQVPRRWSEMVRQGHLGLIGAFERAEAIAGKLEVISSPGKGTLVQAVVPRTLA